MTAETSLLTRNLPLGSYGKDVDAFKRSVARGLDKLDGGKRLKAHIDRPATVRRTMGPFALKDLNALRAKFGFAKTVKGDKVFWQYMVKKGFPDAWCFELMQQYLDAHKPAPPAPKYVEPRQGFNSLDKRLWPLFTTGRNMGLSDLGTYNRASRLPSGLPSDHAVYPAVAFDLGFSPQVGYGHPVARSFFHMMAGHPDCHYTILGNKIWSVEKGLHDYRDGGHEGHVHVSGYRR